MAKNNEYKPPYQIDAPITRLIAEISEAIGRITALSDTPLAPQLRRENRIKTIHASLAIEQNTLTLDQVTAVIEGKRVLGSPREIQEVRNALAAYDAMGEWEPASRQDLLTAHALLMTGLTDEAGRFRSGGVGVVAGGKIVHMAPPAKLVPELVHNLLEWLRTTGEHPLIASSLLHYELEFIHPFADGNGRMGRLWQTLALMQWKPVLAWLPVETVIKHHQAEYYKVLSECDKAGDATLFVKFILQSLSSAIAEISQTDQVFDQETDQVHSLLEVLGASEMSGAEAMRRLSLSHKPTFRQNYLAPALEHGLIERTVPDSPRSPRQKYRLTAKGNAMRTSLLQRRRGR